MVFILQLSTENLFICPKSAATIKPSYTQSAYTERHACLYFILIAKHDPVSLLKYALLKTICVTLFYPPFCLTSSLQWWNSKLLKWTIYDAAISLSCGRTPSPHCLPNKTYIIKKSHFVPNLLTRRVGIPGSSLLEHVSLYHQNK